MVPQEAAHLNRKKGPYIKMATPLGSWDQDGENEIFLPRKHVFQVLTKVRHADVLKPFKLYFQESIQNVIAVL